MHEFLLFFISSLTLSKLTILLFILLIFLLLSSLFFFSYFLLNSLIGSDINVPLLYFDAPFLCIPIILLLFIFNTGEPDEPNLVLQLC